MPWVPIAMAVASAAMSAKSQSDKQDAQKKYNDATAESNKFSPWTGIHNQIQPGDGSTTTGAALQGGIQGLSAAQGFNAAHKSEAPTGGSSTMGGGSSGMNAQDVNSPQSKSIYEQMRAGDGSGMYAGTRPNNRNIPY